MSRLLAEGKRVPVFSLKSADGRADVRLESFLRKKRIVLLLLSDAPGAEGDNGRAWLKAAREACGEFAERDMAVLVVARDPDAIPEAGRLSEPFVVLRDARGEVAGAFGAAPAFYLVGKDTGIKRSSRTCPSLKDLFGLIDGMPMRRQEMRERGG